MDTVERLQVRGIQPSAQRVAVARYVLSTSEHPSADQVWSRVRESFPHVSRATIYNTLKLFVDRGLLRQFVLTEGCVVFDPNLADHHHFIDDDSGEIVDVPWNALDVSKVANLKELDVREYQVVLRGRRKPVRAGKKK